MTPNLLPLAAVGLLLASIPANAKDHFLTIGGGYSPTGNQVSLERNVIFFRKFLAEKLPNDAPHDLYFADGTSPNPDLNYQLEDQEVPLANSLMAVLFLHDPPLYQFIFP